MDSLIVDTVLETKFMRPSLSGDHISRKRIHALLKTDSQYRMNLIHGSAGFGKTTAVIDFLEHTGESGNSIWLNLEARDDDPMRFWFYVFTGFSRTYSPCSDLLCSMSSDSGNIDLMVAGFINRISRIPHQIYLVLDDFQYIRCADLLRSFAFFIEHLPSHVTVLAVSRLLPPLPLSRWRGKGWLKEVAERELRFNEGEAGELIRDIPGHHSPDLLTDIINCTEGWITGLRLALISLQKGASEIGDIFTGINGRERFIDSYLSTEIFDPLEEDIRLFLISTSILDILSPEVCDYLIERDDSLAVLSTLEEIHLFVVPLGDNLCRYHHLFRDYLLRKLKESSPAYCKSLHLKAADWFRQQSDNSRVIYYLIQAEAYESAADAILDECRSYIASGDNGTLVRYIESIPEDILVKKTELMLWYTLALSNLLKIEQTRKWLCQLLNYCTPGSETPLIRGGIAAVKSRLSYMSSDKIRCLELGLEALEILPEKEALLRADLESDIAGAYRHIYNYEKALEHFQRASEIADKTGNARTDVTAVFNCSWIYQDMGRMNEARKLLNEAGRRINGKRALSSLIDLGKGFIEYEEGNFPEALKHMLTAREKSHRSGDLKHLTYIECALSLLYFAMGEGEKSHESAQKVSRLIESCELDSLAQYSGERLSHLGFLKGHILDVARWVSGNPVFPEEAGKFEWTGMIHLELGVSSPETGDEIRKLQTERREFFKNNNLHREYARDRMIIAAARAGRGDTSLLKEALGEAQKSGSVAVAAEQLALVPDLDLTEFMASLRVDYRERLRAWLASACRREFPETAPSQSALTEDLSNREIEILELVGEGESNREIAANLFIAQTTVKWHVKNIMSKLEVKNRTAAVARARELGLLP